MRKYLFCVLILLFLTTGFVSADVFGNKTDIHTVEENLPEFNDIACKFTQNKFIANSGRIISSGGNFYFNKESGITFETLYPIRSTVSYPGSSGRQINKIVEAISHKNYAFIEKNFSVYFEKKINLWVLALVPLNVAPFYEAFDYIKISGNNTIDNIEIKATNGDMINLKFICPKG